MTRERLDLLRRWGVEKLKAARIETAALDARVLLQHCLGLDHSALIAQSDREFEADEFRSAIARRASHEPVSRITGEREFYGRSFAVTPNVLDPRPDTETLVEAALALPWQRLLDLGAGSGALAITLLAERASATGLATDLSGAALSVAAANARRHGVNSRLTLAAGSWFAPVTGQFDLIISNPPYIRHGDLAGLEPEVSVYDPALALDGGADGLMDYRAIAQGLATHLAPRGYALVEIGAGQAGDVSAIFAAAGFLTLARHHDLGGHIRCLAFRPDSGENAANKTIGKSSGLG